MEQGYIRPRKSSFTQIGNQAITDPDLTPNALTVYVKMCYFVSIPDFKLYKTHLQTVSGMGRDTFQKAWRCLIEHGYIKQHQLRANGKFIYEYEIIDTPHTEKPYTVKSTPHTEIPYTVKPATNNTIKNNTRERKKLSKKEDLLENYSCDGQMEITDFPEALPEEPKAASVSIDDSMPASVKASKQYKPEKVLEALKTALKDDYTEALAMAILSRCCILFDGVDDSTIRSPWKYYLSILRNETKDGASCIRKHLDGPQKPKKNSFSNFHQRDYDPDYLERLLSEDVKGA